MWTARTSKDNVITTPRDDVAGSLQDIGTGGSLFKTMTNFR